MPGILVSTVGENPLPVAMSALTIKPDTLILVSSTGPRGTERHAKRVEAVLRRTEPTTKVVHLSVDSGEVDSFAGIHCRFGTSGKTHYKDGLTLRGILASKMPGGSGPFRIDYTGGTAAMVSSLVEFHGRWHGLNDKNAQRVRSLRSYVAVAEDNARLRLDNDGKPRLDNRLSLCDRAELQGWTLKGAYVSARSLDESLTAAISLLAQECAKGETGDEWVEQLATLTRNVSDRLGLGPRRQNWRDESPEHALKGVRGWASEVVALGAVIEAMKGLGSSVPIELVVNAELNASSGSSPTFTEFDILLRLGNAVVAIEVKSREGTTERFSLEILRRVLATERVFGAAARMVWWPIADGTPEHARTIHGSFGEFLGAPFTPTIMSLSPMVDIQGSVRDLHDTLAKIAEGQTVGREAAHAAPEGWIRERLGDLRAGESDNAVLSSGQDNTLNVVSGMGKDLGGVKLIDQLGLKDGKNLDLQKHVLVPKETKVHFPRGVERIECTDVYGVSTATAVIEEVLSSVGRSTDSAGPTLLYITPGTKALTSALTDVHVRWPALTELIAVNVARNSVLTRRLSGFKWKDEGKTNWMNALNTVVTQTLGERFCLRYRPLDEVPTGDTLLERVARGFVSPDVQVDSVLILGGNCRRGCACRESLGFLLPPVVLVGPRRAVPVVYEPAPDNKGSDEERRRERKRFKHQLGVKVAIASQLIGPASKVLVILDEVLTGTDGEDACMAATHELEGFVPGFDYFFIGFTGDGPTSASVVWERVENKKGVRLMKIPLKTAFDAVRAYVRPHQLRDQEPS